jgi:hypothetical protein
MILSVIASTRMCDLFQMMVIMFVRSTDAHPADEPRTITGSENHLPAVGCKLSGDDFVAILLSLLITGTPRQKASASPPDLPPSSSSFYVGRE